MNIIEYTYRLAGQVPKGMVSSYGDLARGLGDIRASRAVGTMMGQNPYAPKVPCHRIVESNGKIGGFAKGISKKIDMLRGEGVSVIDGKILNFEKRRFTDFDTDYPLKRLRHEQLDTAKNAIIKDEFENDRYIAGVDIGHSVKLTEPSVAAISVYDTERRGTVWEGTVTSTVDFPYIPTYLTFREFPLIDKVVSKAKDEGVDISILLIDGNGILHPMRAGIAVHTGVKLNIPAIGCAKSLLCGTPMGEPSNKGEWVYVSDGTNKIGVALKSSKKARKNIYISPGHRVSLGTSVETVKNLCTYRVPEPIRRAHKLARETRRGSD